MTFVKFATKVKKNIDAMQGKEVYTVQIDPNDLWDQYLNAFPAGSNEVFRERTEHDCSCCKNFIRNVGNTVTISNGQIKTIWDIEGAPYPYDVVAQKMDEIVRGTPIASVYRAKQLKHGTKRTYELREGNKSHAWDHFHGEMPSNTRAEEPDAVKSAINSKAQVMRRGLEELTADAVSTVLDLIEENAIYRGAENKSAVTGFSRLQDDYRKINDPVAREIFIWDNIDSSAARMRNTAIGTLVQDISEGKPVEDAVRMFESKVAPANYKRPKAVITKKMVENAANTLRDLGKESALKRRFARIDDVSVNNVLFVDNAVQEQMKDGIEGLLADEVKPKTVDVKKATDITVDEFMAQVVPKASTLDVVVENRHTGNFMSLTAPADEDTGGLFQWGNDFAWTYDGDVADSIKERVKRAGGKVDAKLRVSLAWFNTDDLDIHVREPDGNHIYHGNRCGKLDVDMNVSTPVRDAVENVRWDRLKDGIYEVSVNNFTQREDVDIGFELEVECAGMLETYTYNRKVSGKVRALELHVKNGALQKVQTLSGIKAESRSIDKWGVTTNSLARVDTLMLSPNHWDENAVGNKHWFFILKGCQNPQEARGIYNEFLHPSLQEHRKVFEVLGTKTKCPKSEDQLSGVGFSSTKKDTATVIAKGDKLNRAYNVHF